MQAIVLGWRKGMASLANTYLMEIEGDEMWFGYLGKGGAHWEPGLPTFSATRRIHHDLGHFDQTMIHAASSKINKAVANTILDKYKAEIQENLDLFVAEGRPALAGAKKTWSTTRAAFAADSELAPKLPRGGPPAIANEGPFITGKQDGKPVFVAVTPDAPVDAAGMLAFIRGTAG